MAPTVQPFDVLDGSDADGCQHLVHVDDSGGFPALGLSETAHDPVDIYIYRPLPHLSPNISSSRRDGEPPAPF